MSVAAPFAAILGAKHVLTGETDRIFHSHDIAGPGLHVADAVVRPGSFAELMETVRQAAALGIALFPRGGGLSYTGGYTPSRSPSLIVDLRRLDRVVRIDAVNNRVTAEAGCTWRALYDALAAHRPPRRVPSFGPLSGHGATVGGTVSQDGGFFGTAGHGSIAASVVRLAVVTGSGAIVRPGIDVADDMPVAPFIGDCGALGLKAEVTLALEPVPGATRFLSFAFDSMTGVLAAMQALAGLPGLGEAMSFDEVGHANLARSGFSVLEGAGIAADLLAAPGGWRARIASVIKAASAGKAFVAELQHSFHVAIDGADEEECGARAAEAAERAQAAGGRPIPDVIPRVTRARPFRPIKSLLGPEGENWLPVHGVVPAAQAPDAYERCRAALDARAGDMARLGVRVTVLTVLSGAEIVVEPQMFWPDRLSPFHLGAAQPDQIKAYRDRPANPQARALAFALRDELSAALDAAGARHYQIGRYYRPPAAAVAAIAALRRRLDPAGLVNPGVLGL
jgi:D-lactate dehydrogenase (cytochrome)